MEEYLDDDETDEMWTGNYTFDTYAFSILDNIPPTPAVHEAKEIDEAISSQLILEENCNNTPDAIPDTAPQPKNLPCAPEIMGKVRSIVLNRQAKKRAMDANGTQDTEIQNFQMQSQIPIPVNEMEIEIQEEKKSSKKLKSNES